MYVLAVGRLNNRNGDRLQCEYFSTSLLLALLNNHILIKKFSLTRHHYSILDARMLCQADNCASNSPLNVAINIIDSVTAEHCREC